jgi:LysR family transcriptional regulator, nitrogen assimilation regulatory protein
MDLKQLDYFLRVAELGSFTRAAEVLSIAQPALSRQVRLLEVELRQSLLTRNGRGAFPTEAGKVLMEHARGILHQVQRAREDLRSVQQDGGTHGGNPLHELTGRVAIGLPPSLARLITVPLTRQFRVALPRASLSIAEGLSASLQEAVANGRLDIALVYGAVASRELEVRPLLEEELVLVSQGGANRKLAALPLRELPEFPLIIPARPNSFRVLVETQLARLGLAPTIALEVDGTATILDLVASGIGSAVLPRHAVSLDQTGRDFQVRAIIRPKLVSAVSVVTSARRARTPLLEAALTMLMNLQKPAPAGQ